MKKSLQEIVRRTRGRDNTDRINGYDGNDRMRWRTRSENISKKAAANDEANKAWRAAA